ncbi:SigE family RNA polymerase sigma factor [Actinoplanes sp. NPDC051633]|uniref:SigE family RNA polymerase sigma factor n=1 Tax=Actinoplanes sp. NPDC051633 TaxID=3155670 RepID=UPI00341F6FD8
MGDDRLFADFVRNRGAALYRYGYLLAGNHHDADDLVQDALIKLRAHWSRVVRQDDPMGYVRTTMARTHVSSWRRRRRELPSAALPDEPVADPGLDRAETSTLAVQVWAALAELPRRQRAVLVLRYYEHLSDAEIATVLGVRRVTVRSHAFRGLEKLRAHGIAALEGVTS